MAMTWQSKAELISVDVDNPHFSADHAESQTNPRRIRATKNLRESAVETLFARGRIDEAQKRAADRFRATWEACGGAGGGAMDYSREPVDGGGAREPLTQRQVDAGKALMACRTLLGARNYDLVCKVCGQGFGLQEVSPRKRDQLTAADNLRASLDDLAELWGLAHRKRTA